MRSARNRNPPTAPPAMAAIGVDFAVELVLTGSGNTVTLTSDNVLVAMEGAIEDTPELVGTDDRNTVVTLPFVSVAMPVLVGAEDILAAVGVEGALAEVDVKDISELMLDDIVLLDVEGIGPLVLSPGGVVSGWSVMTVW